VLYSKMFPQYKIFYKYHTNIESCIESVCLRHFFSLPPPRAIFCSKKIFKKIPCWTTKLQAAAKMVGESQRPKREHRVFCCNCTFYYIIFTIITRYHFNKYTYHTTNHNSYRTTPLGAHHVISPG
jgi:hypothetical protein